MELNLNDLPKNECLRQIESFLKKLNNMGDEKIILLPIDILEQDNRDKFEIINILGMPALQIPLHLFLVIRDLKTQSEKIEHIVDFLFGVSLDFTCVNTIDATVTPLVFTQFDTVLEYIKMGRVIYLLEKFKFNSVKIIDAETYGLKRTYSLKVKCENNVLIIATYKDVFEDLNEVNAIEKLTKFLTHKVSGYLVDNSLIKI